MKNNRIIRFIPALLMLLILSSARVDAATVAKIGNKSYSSISKAISVVKNGQTIQIIKNTKWKVPAGGSPEIKNKKVTMDLNGHTVTLYPVDKVIKSGSVRLTGATLNIKNGTLKEGGEGVFRFRAEKKSKLNLSNLRMIVRKDSFDVYDKGSSLTMKAVKMTHKGDVYTTIYVSKGASAVISSGTYTTYGQLIGNSGGTVTIKGGTFRYPESNVMTSMIANSNTTDLDGKRWTGKMVITGGKFISENYIVVDNYIGASVKISGKAVIEGGSPVRSQGKLTMTGGKIHAKKYNNSYSSYTSPAIDSSGAPKGCTVILSGGTLISDGNAAVIISKDTVYKNTGATLQPAEGYDEVITR